MGQFVGGEKKPVPFQWYSDFRSCFKKFCPCNHRSISNFEFLKLTNKTQYWYAVFHFPQLLIGQISFKHWTMPFQLRVKWINHIKCIVLHSVWGMVDSYTRFLLWSIHFVIAWFNQLQCSNKQWQSNAGKHILNKTERSVHESIKWIVHIALSHDMIQIYQAIK